MPQIDSWFPTLVYTDQLAEFTNNQYLLDRARSLRQQNSGQSALDWHCNTYTTLGSYHFREHGDPVEHQLIAAIRQRVVEFSREYGIDSSHDSRLLMTGGWYNIAGPGGFQEIHQHENSHFSAVYYVDAAANSGDLVFTTLGRWHDMYRLPVALTEPGPANHRFCQYTPQTGRLVIFRSNLLHYVNPNLSGQERVGISMNFGYLHN